MNPEIFSKQSKAIVYGFQTNPIQRMLDFDYVCGRKDPSVACVVNPGNSSICSPFFGNRQILVPVHDTLKEACQKHKDADVLINLASFRSAYRVTKEALNAPSIRTVVVIAEGVPERQTRELIALAKSKGKLIIGPSTVGGVSAGRFRIANSAGTIENIINCRLYRPGCVGLVTKSGGLLNEMFNVVAKNADGAYEGIAIGGDSYPASTLLDHALRFEKIQQVKMIVVLGELGSMDELEIAKAVKDGRIKKPVVAWVTGTCADIFPTQVQFGHAGAASGNPETSAHAKNQALRQAGVIVPKSFDSIGEEIAKVYSSLLKKGALKPIQEPKLPEIKRAKPAQFISTISDDRGEDVKYLGVPLPQLLKQGAGIGDVIGRLWFKKSLPPFASKFIELVLVTTADHGPAVSGAHNAIVAACAGKDMVSSLCSGLLTIGPRFGGAIDGAAREFRHAVDSGQKPSEFVERMKAQNKYIPGIGHRIKSLKNPDGRVEILKAYARKNFKTTKYLDYALNVEKLTADKKANLILNVDGAIGVLFLDLMDNCRQFTRQEISEIVENGCLNGLFALGRSIGIIGHIIDQKRLRSPLYRVPEQDILYVSQ